MNLRNDHLYGVNLTLENHWDQRVIINRDGEVIFYPNFFSTEESDRLFSELYSGINWRQDQIKMWGKKIPIPRLTAWYGDEGKSYIYSGINHEPTPWNCTLKIIKSRIETIAKVEFNSVLLNLYRTGKDSVSWHSDDEPELGKNPPIASVSFGATRRFCLRHKKNKDYQVNIDLTHGSLLLMQDKTQHYWLHQIPKTKQNVAPRINLTFRVIKPV